MSVRAPLAIACALLLAAAPAGARPEPKTTLPDVADEVMCLTCGVLLDEAPDSPQAQRERAFIAALIARGKSKDQIEQALVRQYGPEVLAQPGTSGFDLTAWLVPGLAILLAATGIAAGVWRWRRAARAEPAPSPAAIDPADAERLSADLERYEL